MLVSCALGSLNLVSGDCLMVATSLDRIHVWETSVKFGWGRGGGGGVLSVFVLEILCKHVFLWVCAFPRLRVSLSVSRYLCHGDILTCLFLLSLCGYRCLHADASSSFFFFSLPSPVVGAPQGLSEGLRHEAAQQIRDDKAVGLCLLLGGEAHHGLLQQSLGHAGVQA